MAFLITRAEFWLNNFGFKRSLLSLLKQEDAVKKGGDSTKISIQIESRLAKFE